MRGLLARLRPPQGVVAALVAAATLVVLIPAAVMSTMVTVMVFAMLVLFLLLVVLGFGRTSELFVILGVLLVPLTRMHPVDAVSFITYADTAFAVGFGLMLPDLMRRPLHLPPVFVLGVSGVFSVALLSSLLADDPAGSLNVLTRLLVGAFGLTILINWWSPGRTKVLIVACAYVLGNVISVAYGVLKHEVASDGRRAGLAEHPNVYGLCALLAVTIIPFIVTQFPPNWRWLPPALGVVCLYGVWSSGSRAALAVMIGVALIYPVLARSVLAGIGLLAAVTGVLFFIGQLLGEDSTGNALGRLLGSGSASASDQARELLFQQAVDRFWSSPIIGSGLAGIIEAHVIYIQIAAGLGVIGLGFYLLVLWSTVQPLTVLTPPFSLLALPALSYVILGFVTPVMWDRYIWVLLALAVLSPRLAEADAVPADEESPEGSGGLHRRIGVADASR